MPGQTLANLNRTDYRRKPNLARLPIRICRILR
jgi:hypothetical protein